MNEYNVLYPEMTTEIAENNNVCSAARCEICRFFNPLGGTKDFHNDGGCDKLKCHTWETDICKHFEQI